VGFNPEVKIRIIKMIHHTKSFEDTLNVIANSHYDMRQLVGNWKLMLHKELPTGAELFGPEAEQNWVVFTFFDGSTIRIPSFLQIKQWYERHILNLSANVVTRDPTTNTIISGETPSIGQSFLGSNRLRIFGPTHSDTHPIINSFVELDTEWPSVTVGRSITNIDLDNPHANIGTNLDRLQLSSFGFTGWGRPVSDTVPLNRDSVPVRGVGHNPAVVFGTDRPGDGRIVPETLWGMDSNRVKGENFEIAADGNSQLNNPTLNPLVPSGENFEAQVENRLVATPNGIKGTGAISGNRAPFYHIDHDGIRGRNVNGRLWNYTVDNDGGLTTLVTNLHHCPDVGDDRWFYFNEVIASPTSPIRTFPFSETPASTDPEPQLPPSHFMWRKRISVPVTTTNPWQFNRTTTSTNYFLEEILFYFGTNGILYQATATNSAVFNSAVTWGVTPYSIESNSDVTLPNFPDSSDAQIPGSINFASFSFAGINVIKFNELNETPIDKGLLTFSGVTYRYGIYEYENKQNENLRGVSAALILYRNDGLDDILDSFPYTVKLENAINASSNIPSVAKIIEDTNFIVGAIRSPKGFPFHQDMHLLTALLINDENVQFNVFPLFDQRIQENFPDYTLFYHEGSAFLTDCKTKLVLSYIPLNI
jgi:hypothetical protein